MSARVVITDQTGQVAVPSGKFGQITDIHIVAGGTRTDVALYEGATPVAANLLSIHKVAANTSLNLSNLKIQFSDAGVYASVDANTQALIFWGEWGGGKATPVLSGG
jgi:hypothetical protein